MQDHDVNGKARSRASGGLAHPKTINDQAKEIKSIHESQKNQATHGKEAYDPKISIKNCQDAPCKGQKIRIHELEKGTFPLI